MSSRTYVCFDCRTTERIPLSRLTRDCRKCRKPAEHVYFKLRIPRADDERGWEKLRVAVRTINTTIKARALGFLRGKAERYERGIPGSPAHQKTKTQRYLREIHARITQWERWR